MACDAKTKESKVETVTPKMWKANEIKQSNGKYQMLEVKR